jgi:hypothetical protein
MILDASWKDTVLSGPLYNARRRLGWRRRYSCRGCVGFDRTMTIVTTRPAQKPASAVGGTAANR